MKLVCTQENLARGLNIVSHITSKNINLPILNNVLVKIEDKSVRLSTTNLEVAINCTLRGKIDEPGEFTLPSRLFSDYVNLLPAEAVEIETTDTNLGIKCGNYETKIKGLPASEFPLIPQVVKKKVYSCSASEFKRALSQVIFAVSPNESKPEFAGICMEINRENESGRLVLAATDTYRLGEASLALEKGSGAENASAIVPVRTMAEVLRILSAFKDDAEAPENLEIAFSESQIVFTLGNAELISRVIEGQYPDYRQIVPADFKVTAKLSRDELAKAIKTTSLFSKTGLFDVTLEFVPPRGIIIRSIDLQTGENKVELAGEVSGAENKITLNYRYLLEGLNALPGSEVSFSLVDAANPCLIRSIGNEKEYFYIVMPIKQ
ncbi:MAG: DNA polymerase III subunit beta [Patescibacteria group bacterium]|nr:DNA polymerase III subunit beta [Patescibacteria group bacterium]